MRKSNLKLLCLGFIFAGLMGFGTSGMNYVVQPTQAQGGENATGTTETSEAPEMHTENNRNATQ